MTQVFRPRYRSVRLITGAVVGLGLAAMQAACAPQTEQTSNAALAQISQADQAERMRAVQHVSDALGRRLDRMVLNASLTAQR